jgi:antitoxin (DNA-binding transcriptional repressor) of toxin-antitoxin stability system
MSKVVNIHEAKTHLSRIIEEVLAGEDITIAKAGVPLIDLKIHEVKRPQFGFMKGLIVVPEGYNIDEDSEFDLAAFYGEEEPSI